MSDPSRDRYCKNCGHQISPTGQYCEQCGEPIRTEDNGDQTVSGGAGNRDESQRRDQRSQNNPDEQTQPQSTQGTSSQEHPDGQRANDDGKFTRRQLLLGGAAAVGGVILLNEISGSDSAARSPEGVISQLLDVVKSGIQSGSLDPDRAGEIYHDFSPERDDISEFFFDGSEIAEISAQVDSVEFNVERTAVINRAPAPETTGVQEFALVEYTFSITASADGETETGSESGRYVAAQNNNGEWKYWQESTELPN